MNKTLAFVAMDFNSTKPYLKSSVLLLALGMIMGVTFRSSSILSAYFMVMLLTVMSYPFAIGDKNGLDTLFGTLSINRKNIVLGRYLFVIAVQSVCGVVTLLCSMLLNMIIGLEFVLSNEIFIIFLLSGIFAAVVSLQYPIYFKLGYNRAKMIALAPLLVAFIGVFQFPALARRLNWNISWEELFANLQANPFLVYAAPIGVGLLCLAISCRISCRIYSKRDL